MALISSGLPRFVSVVKNAVQPEAAISTICKMDPAKYLDDDLDKDLRGLVSDRARSRSMSCYPSDMRKDKSILFLSPHVRQTQTKQQQQRSSPRSTGDSSYL